VVVYQREGRGGVAQSLRREHEAIWRARDNSKEAGPATVRW
jgi:hypothetical protein